MIPIIGIYEAVYTYNWYHTEGSFRSLNFTVATKAVTSIVPGLGRGAHFKCFLRLLDFFIGSALHK